jgi:hypothetical protein
MTWTFRYSKGPCRLTYFSRVLVLWTGVIVPLVCTGAIIRGPYLSFVNDPHNSIVVNWGTETPAAGVVEYGMDTQYSNAVTEASPDTLHSIEITELLANTHYYYRVTCDADSAIGDFWTAPTPSETFGIIAYGDSRSNPMAHRRVVDRYMQYPHRLILNAGDLAYHGELWEFDEYLFQPAAIALATSPFISCVGSHDADPWNTPPNFTFENYCNLMTLPGNELYFSFDYGPIHMVILDSEVAWHYEPSTPQTQWLTSDLASTHQPYRIVIFHMPPYTSGTGNPSVTLIRQHWCPIFREHHVQLVLNGHQHFYQRCEPGDGIKYIITGGGGAGLYAPTFDSSYVVAAAQAYHFVWLDVNPDSIHVTAIDTTNTILDQFSIFPWSSIIPEAVRHMTIQRDAAGVHLTWNAVRHDIAGAPITVNEYHIYIDTVTPDFMPVPQYLEATTQDTTWTDSIVSPDVIHAFYQITAVLSNP